MCTIIFVDDEWCDTGAELAEALDIDLDMIPADGHTLTPNECLCNVNIEAICHLFEMDMQDEIGAVRLTSRRRAGEQE